MRVLILNLYYPPDTSATAKMAQTVAETIAEKHEVTVLCGRPSYDPAERRPWHFFQTEQSGKVRVIRVGSTDYSRVRMKRRVLNYLSYTALCVPRAVVFPCEVVLAMTDPPFEGIVGAAVARIKRKPYIYNIRDMYPDMAVGGEIVQPGIMAQVWEKLHRWALRRATRIVVLGEDMKNRIVGKGADTTRVKVVRDGAEIPPPGAATPGLDENIIAEIRGDSKFVLVHAGNLGFYGAWDTLLQGMKQLEGESIRLVFVGDGAQRERLRKLASGMNHVRFLPFYPGSKIPSVLAAADAHVITVKRGLEGVVVPSKMYGILAAGKPIVALAPRECDVVALGIAQGFSVAADPDDAAAFSKCVRELATNPERVRAMGTAARRAAPQFERRAELKKFLSILEESAG